MKTLLLMITVFVLAILAGLTLGRLVDASTTAASYRMDAQAMALPIVVTTGSGGAVVIHPR